jgi:hypothetical protein
MSKEPPTPKMNGTFARASRLRSTNSSFLGEEIAMNKSCRRRWP